MLTVNWKSMPRTNDRKSSLMDFKTFEQSLKNDQPPAGIPAGLKALWWDGKNNWQKAHQVAQEIKTADGAWVHAYLHRKEGDQGNAGYWYSRANKPKGSLSLAEEWAEIVKAFLA